MKSAFAGTCVSASVDSLRQLARQPKLAGKLASEGWTTDMFVETVFNELSKKK